MKQLVSHSIFGALLSFCSNSLFAATTTHANHTPTAGTEINACVFDITGSSGDIFSMMRDYSLFAQKNNVKLKLTPYLDERIASEDFRAGKCDLITLTGLRGRQFNSFTGSIEALGAVNNPNTAKALMQILANPKLAGDMVVKQFEVAGVLPLGSVFLVSNDKNINTLGKMAGKKLAVLDYDKAQRKMAEKIGVEPVSAELSSLASKFNKGVVDIVAVPAMAIKPLELYKGMGTKGGIARFPVVTLSGNVILNKDKFPKDFGQKSREWVAGQIPRFMNFSLRLENEIPDKYWIDIPADDQLAYVRILREARISLTKEGVYNKKMMSIIKRIRCKQDPNSFECPLGEE